MTQTPAAAVEAPDWEAWRASYDTMTFADQQKFYEQVFKTCRVQRQFDVSALGRLLDWIARDGWHIGPVFEIVELGGWDGELAAETLQICPRIDRWTNFEISKGAAAAAVCDDPRYEAVALRDWFWAEEHSCEVFVASHVLEHLRFADVQAVFASVSAHWLFLQAPLRSGPTDWAGYHGSHILEVGWGAIAADLDERGYRQIDEISNAGVRCFTR